MNDLRKNVEGYSDPTAYEAIQQVVLEEEAKKEEEARARALIRRILRISRAEGFYVMSRIELRFVISGRVY